MICASEFLAFVVKLIGYTLNIIYLRAVKLFATCFLEITKRLPMQCAKASLFNGVVPLNFERVRSVDSRELSYLKLLWLNSSSNKNSVLASFIDSKIFGL